MERIAFYDNRAKPCVLVEGFRAIRCRRGCAGVLSRRSAMLSIM